jgi:hypothetical protein
MATPKTKPHYCPENLTDHGRELIFFLLDENIFTSVRIMITSLPKWKGSLEDATVAVTALRYRCPVWTLNYRDFSIFQSLEFWNPDPT